jgi:PPK2 family polyphosphate:nucleotide phosphotransferase
MAKRSEFSLLTTSSEAPASADKEDIRDRTAEICEQIGELHSKIMADGKTAVLVVLQGMDSSGKDGVSRTILTNCTPSGYNYKSFKAPTQDEMDHDFLWRIHQHTPAKGTMTVFNRSHYEDVLYQRVNGWIDDKKVEMRMRAINAFEHLLAQDNNTLIIKMYLHISPERQKEKLLERLENPKKNWKHNPGDWEQREKWDAYRSVYHDVFEASEQPWFIIPADQEWYRDYVAASVLLKQLQSLNLKFPLLTAAEKAPFLNK